MTGMSDLLTGRSTLTRKVCAEIRSVSVQALVFECLKTIDEASWGRGQGLPKLRCWDQSLLAQASEIVEVVGRCNDESGGHYDEAERFG